MTVSLSRGELLWLLITVFFVPFVHLLGLMLAAFGAYDRWHNGRLTAFVIFTGLGLLAGGLEVADLV